MSVEDGVDDLAGRDFLLQRVQETDELLVPVSGHVASDDGALERGEQGGGPVPLVVVGHRAGPTLLHRQSRLRPVERLDLRLFVDREPQRHAPAG